jgi:hypothetical protein
MALIPALRATLLPMLGEGVCFALTDSILNRVVSAVRIWGYGVLSPRIGREVLSVSEAE